MNLPASIYLRPGTPGLRSLPTLRYHRASVRDLRRFPIRENPALEVLDYRLTAAPGLINPAISRPRTHGHGAVRLAGFILNLCVVHLNGEWFLETETLAFDEAAACRAGITWDVRLLADLYRAVEQKHLAAQGRAYCGRAEVRN